MKKHKRIVSFISLLMMIVPLILMFPYTVSADTYDPSVDTVPSGYTLGGIREYVRSNYDIDYSKKAPEQTYPKLRLSIYGVSSNSWDGYIICDNTDYIILTLERILFEFRKKPDTMTIYFASYVTPYSNRVKVTSVVSTSPLYFNVTNSQKIYLESLDTSKDSYVLQETFGSSSGSSSSSFRGKFIQVSGYQNFYHTINDSSYGNYHGTDDSCVFVNGLGFDGYPDFLSNPDMSKSVNFSDYFTKPLSEQIDVTLTPEFGVGMDRVFDQNTGQNDYFKLEVTNNSNTNIQFCASIVPKGKTSDFIYMEEFNNYDVDSYLYEHALWNYVYQCTYYRLAYKSESQYGFLVKNLNYYIEKDIGNCFWVFLSPGEHFEDYIYWENIKIFPSTEYDFVISAMKLPESCDYATEAFPSDKRLHEDYDKETSWYNFWTNLNLDDSAYQYMPDFVNNSVLDIYIDSLYRVTFSVFDIPKFSPVVKGGNAKISGGWNDTKNQLNNPYYKENTKTGEVEAVSNWSEYTGELSDVNVDISNVSLSDVSSLISYSQDYFNLLKKVLSSFPPWIWVTLCFGFTGLIVIGIIKAIL